jgi:predicted dehydrogenase
LIKRLVEAKFLGGITRFDVEEGGQFNWPLRTSYLFQNSTSGGALGDTGTHLFDLLFWILGSRTAHLVRYRDDSWRGVEANAIIDLKLTRDSREIPGRVEVSFTRSLRNTLRIYGENGYLEAPTLGGYEVTFCQGNNPTEPVLMRSDGEGPKKMFKEFAVQLSNFVDLIMNNAENYSPSEEALPVLSLVEECRRSRKLLVNPWETKHLESFFASMKDAS